MYLIIAMAETLKLIKLINYHFDDLTSSHIQTKVRTLTSQPNVFGCFNILAFDDLSLI
jgi:hypothetical protein